MAYFGDNKQRFDKKRACVKKDVKNSGTQEKNKNTY